jgi:alpha-1,6-mannosyltransferase
LTAAKAGRVLFACGAGITLLLLVALSLHVPGSIWAGTLARKNAIVGLLGAAGLLYFAAVALVLRAPPPMRSVWWVAGLALAMRAALVVSPPFMSSDVYRYVWDGRVQAAGINPYRYVPADPALAHLRDAAVYPNINRATYAHTIYPPAAQALFAAIGRISQTVWATKLAIVLLEAGGMAAMLRVLAIAGLPAARLLIYAWNPLAAWSIAGDGHIDGAAVGFLGLALLACTARRSGLSGAPLTGALLAGAILTKFLPLVVAPALWRRRDWRMPLACAVVIGGLYACYASVGWQVFGFLPAYTSEEGMAQGGGFWLLKLLGQVVALPPIASAAYLAVSCSLLGAAALWVMAQPTSPDAARDAVRVCGNTAILAAGTVFAMSPHYPWYYVWLALPSIVMPWRSVVFLSAAPLILYSDPFHNVIVLPTLVFIPAAILAVADYTAAARGRAASPKPEECTP